MNKEFAKVWAQVGPFWNPEDHEPDCPNPDKMFRFCECDPE